MKKTLYLLLVLTMSVLLTAPAFAQRGDHGRPQKNADHNQGHGHQHIAPPAQAGAQHGDHNYYDRSRDRHYEYRNPAHHPHGYIRQPHGRKLGPRQFSHGHKFHYEGHWQSWDTWKRYRDEHRDRYQSGRYYKDNGHLFFGFCDPSGGACFYFSIGR
jgi:hypothetical protein